MELVTTHHSGTFWLEGPLDRLHVDDTTALCTGTFVNTAGGEIHIGPHAFFGPWAMLLTGHHDYTRFGPERMHGGVYDGRDSSIVVGEGAWVAGGAIVVGPCRIGAHAVIAAGAVVTGTVPEYALMRGNPAVQVKDVRWPDEPWPHRVPDKYGLPYELAWCARCGHHRSDHRGEVAPPRSYCIGAGENDSRKLPQYRCHCAEYVPPASI